MKCLLSWCNVVDHGKREASVYNFHVLCVLVCVCVCQEWHSLFVCVLLSLVIW